MEVGANMIQPNELRLNLPVELANGVMSTTTEVWSVLEASIKGDLERVKGLVALCPELSYAQYNYAPPIHFAVREGHLELVAYLLEHGAFDPGYRIYPFLDTLQTLAEERGYGEIVELLNEYAACRSRHRYKGDNGRIHFQRTEAEQAFEEAVDAEDLNKTERLLRNHPEFAKDDTYFWGEGILAFAAKKNNRAMVDLLMSYGAKVPAILKWAQFYYFEHEQGAAYMMEKGMNPDTMSCHRVTLLHDMAQKGNLPKAELLLRYGASIDPVDEQYRSTPLGMAVRWGHADMVKRLLKQGADPNKAGASWATPLSWAKRKGNAEIERLLRKAGAK